MALVGCVFLKFSSIKGREPTLETISIHNSYDPSGDEYKLAACPEEFLRRIEAEYRNWC